MIPLSLSVNIVVLIAVLVLIVLGGDQVASVYGPDGPALHILACIYSAILLASIALLVLHMTGDPRTRGWVQALLALQVLYKIATLATIGPANPVVIANILIAGLHIVTLSRA